MSDTIDLPDEVRRAMAPHMEPDENVLSAIGIEIAAKRDEARASRASSGIEGTWLECEEAYLGIDKANRHEFTDARWAKPMSMDSPLTTERRPRGHEHRSTVFLRLTSRYVDAGVAKLGEILLPADDKAFSFDCTPVPQLLEAKEDDSHVVHSELGVTLTRPLEPGETPPVAAPAAPAIPAPAAVPPALVTSGVGAAAPGEATTPSSSAIGAAAATAPPQPQAAAQPRVPATVADFARENIEEARAKAKAAETRIYDWMVETNYRAEIRKVIADAARIGVGVLKGPVPQLKKSMAIIDGRPIFKEKIVPGCEWKDPWDIFPDPACGENIHNGSHCFDRDYFSARQVRGLKKIKGYIASQIDKVLEEGPNKINHTQGRGRGSDEQKNRFEIWYFYGQLTKDEMAAIDNAAGNAPQSGDDDDTDREAYCIVTLINDSVVRATINPLDSGSFPFHSMPWQRRAGHWAGVGVAEQMRTPQRVTNSALRALLNNAGKSAGSQFFIRQGAFVPADDSGSWAVTPDKFWLITENGSDDIRKDFVVVQIPNLTEPLMQIITLGERFAEETTSIPLIAQGQSGATTPDTFGAAQLQNNNANQLLRAIGYSFDDYITEPMVRQYYEWLLLDPDVPDEEKGEFQIDAHGSAAMVERAIQDQTISQMGAMAAPGNGYGIDPKKWAEEFLRSKHLKPSAFKYTEEEQQKLDAAPPPEAPAVTVAKINADVAMKQLVATQTADQQTAQHEAQLAAAAHALEVADSQTEQQRVHGDLTMQAHQIDMEHQRAETEENNRLKIALDEAKTQLAKVAMQLQTERDLNAANQAHERDSAVAQQAHEGDQNAADQAHERDSKAADQAHQRDMNATSQAHEMRKHVTPQPPKPAVQVPGRAGNGQAASQAPA